MLFSLVTDKYLLLTSLTLLVIALFRNGVRKLDGSQELGTYGIYLFFCGDWYSSVYSIDYPKRAVVVCVHAHGGDG